MLLATRFVLMFDSNLTYTRLKLCHTTVIKNSLTPLKLAVLLLGLLVVLFHGPQETFCGPVDTLNNFAATFLLHFQPCQSIPFVAASDVNYSIYISCCISIVTADVIIVVQIQVGYPFLHVYVNQIPSPTCVVLSFNSRMNLSI